MEPSRPLCIIEPVTEQVRHAGRTRNSGGELRGGGGCLRHRVELPAQERRHCHSFATDERLLEIIVKMVQHGEFNRIRLANKAIAEFEAQLPA
jgi:hypothetical protein